MVLYKLMYKILMYKKTNDKVTGVEIYIILVVKKELLDKHNFMNWHRFIYICKIVIKCANIYILTLS